MAEQTDVLYDPLQDTPTDALYDRYRVLLEEAPVYHSDSGDVWCIARHDAVHAAAGNWAMFSNADGVDLDVPGGFFGKGDFLDQDPPRHDELRDIVRRRFSPRNVKDLEGQTLSRVDALLDEFEGRSDVDLAAEFAWQLPIWVICRILGIEDALYQTVQQAIKDVSTKEPGASEPSPKMLAGRDELQSILQSTAEAKRSSGDGDVLSELIAAFDAGSIDMEDLIGMSLIMFFAGSETTASLISNGLYLLSEHPDQQAAIRAGTVPLEAAIEEMIRYESPIQYLRRKTTQEITVEEVTIPARADVILLYGAANRDPRRYPDPDTFDVTREQKRHLGFGYGIHFCLGAPLARLEARIAFSRLFERIPRYEVTDVPRWLPNHLIRGIIELPASLSS